MPEACRAVLFDSRSARWPLSSGWAATTAAGSPAASRLWFAVEPPLTPSASTARSPVGDQCSRHRASAGSVPAGTDVGGQATRSLPTQTALAFFRSGADPAREVLTLIWWVART